MQAVPVIPLSVNNLAPVPRPRTLNDLRMGNDNDALSSSSSAISMRPLVAVVLLVAAGAGIAWGVKTVSEQSAAKTAAIRSAQETVLAVPAAPLAPSGVAVAKGSVASDPISPPSRLEAVNPAPPAVPSNKHSGESMNPVRAKSSVAAKSASATAKVVWPMPTAPVIELAAPQSESAPPSPPAPILPVEQPVAPPVAPASITPPAQPATQ